MSGYIYIIKLREHIKTNESIYKIGRTKDINKRFPQYPKGSLLIYCIYTQNIIETESIIIKDLQDYNCNEYGKEYFNCNLTNIKRIIDKHTNITDSITYKFDDKINVTKEKGKIIIDIPINNKLYESIDIEKIS